MPFSADDLQAIWLTLKLASLSTVLLLLLATPLAWWLATSGSRWRAPVGAVVALPLVLPPTVLGFYLLVSLGPQGWGGQLTQALGLGLVTLTPDDIDWDDEIRIMLEERASLSPDAMTGLEASLRFPGKETMETRIFGRLSAWQNWIFIRPNAVGEDGALKLFGTGKKAKFDWKRV